MAKKTEENFSEISPAEMGEILVPMVQSQQLIATQLTKMILEHCNMKDVEPEDVYNIYEESFARVSNGFGEFMNMGGLDD